MFERLRSSHRRCSVKNSVLKNFANFTRKHNSKQTSTQVFFCKFCKNFKNTYFEENLRTAASSEDFEIFKHIWTFIKLNNQCQLCIINQLVLKQHSRGVFTKRFSENRHQTYRRTPTPKCDFNKVAKHSEGCFCQSFCRLIVQVINTFWAVSITFSPSHLDPERRVEIKAFIKPSEAPQRSAKIKIQVTFYFNTTFWNAWGGKVSCLSCVKNQLRGC